MSIKTVLSKISVLASACIFSATVNAATISLVPATPDVDISFGTLALDLFMDFSGPESTVGGGIDLRTSGAVSFLSFTPSAYFDSVNTAPGDDTDFTGFGTADADNDFEIHFGSFGGLQGNNLLGTVLLSLDATGVGNVDILINQQWGFFFSALTFDQQNVALLGATVNVTQTVPIPPAAWLFISGLVILGLRAKSTAR